jgi:hypothetical protein
MTPASARDIAETVALALAGLFFIFRALSGYLIVNTSISIVCRRQRMPDVKRDWLVTEVRLIRGEFGTLSLHDAQVQVRTAETVLRLPLSAADRRSYRTDAVGGHSRRTVDWDQRSRESPFINLSPNEEASFGCVMEVAVDQPCVVEATVIGKRKLSWRSAQWRASCVALPIEAAVVG